MKSIVFVAFLGLLFFAAAARADQDATVELHAHLFMKEGMTYAFHGEFFGPLQAKSWKDRFSSQVNPEALEKSNLAIVVATLYAHPLMTWSLRESIRAQIKLAIKFVASHPDWIIATEPTQARTAIAAGKHVMILALEGASGIIENDADIHEFIDEGGIRIVTPLHLIDDEFGGVAFLADWHVLSNPLAWLKQLFSPPADGVLLNHEGLSSKGRELIRKLIDKNVWIDLAHASDRSTAEILPMLEAHHQPFLYTHAYLRKYHPAERGITEDEIRKIAKSGGILGLFPSEDQLGSPPESADCPNGLYGLVQEYREASAILGSENVMLGSDYNGGVQHLKPVNETGKCKTGTSLDTEGLWNMGQIPDLWKAMKALGAPVPSPLSKMVDSFIAAWSKVRDN